MRRLLAGSAATLLLVTGALFIWQGRAEAPPMPAAPTPRLASSMAPNSLSRVPDAPSADPKTKEEKRFARADKDEDGGSRSPSWSSRGAKPTPNSTSTRTAN